jgi:Protein of unknown function (DUF4232)
MLGSMRLAGRSAAGLVAVAAVIGAATGCTSSPTSSSAAATSSAATSSASSVPTTPSVVTSSAAPSSAAPSAGPSSTAKSSSPRAVASPEPSSASSTACPTKYLAATIGLAQGAAGSVYQVIDFKNISNTTCTLYGYPGVSLASGTPVTQVGAAASRSTETAASVVTLAPGQSANALLRITQALNYPPATCSPVATTYLQIFPPDQFTPIYLAYKSTGCSKTAVILLSISVMTAGTGGN